ncbi:hypothetical protein ACQ5SO_10625 [Rhodovulum sp. DZ06]|uniref:hypothetical protein n=1 Tax=Rhodovulum sp. DZ06 TaxID=3425126 RepID=UPI003D3354B3
MTPLTPEMLRCLRLYEVPERKIAALGGDSQVVADGGIWGDDFDDFYAILSEVYRSDALIPAECMPGEGERFRIPLIWIPFLARTREAPRTPLSFAEPGAIMRAGARPG